MDSFKAIALTYKQLSLDTLGKLCVDTEHQKQILPEISRKYGFSEFLFLTTCNRVEFLFKSESPVTEALTATLIGELNTSIETTETHEIARKAELFEGKEAVAHILKVASSLDSLVVGEREIITQVRKAYDFCNELGLTGDFIRLLLRQTIETAKEIYTHTAIAKNPVSVASLAYRQLRDLGIKDEARIVFVGSGQTNTILANYFQKHRFANFTVFNRSLENANKLAAILKAKAFLLNELSNFKEGFDVLVVCTASQGAIINSEVFERLKNGETSKKVVIDLGVPANVTTDVALQKQVNYIDITSLKARAEANLELRKGEIERCEEIIKSKTELFVSLHHERRIELAFGEVPRQVKAIRELAVNEVFAKELSLLDTHSKEVLDKVLSYMEKKYNAVAIKTAKEVFNTPR